VILDRSNGDRIQERLTLAERIEGERRIGAQRLPDALTIPEVPEIVRDRVEALLATFMDGAAGLQLAIGAIDGVEEGAGSVLEDGADVESDLRCWHLVSAP
jgi:hypothetical protein